MKLGYIKLALLAIFVFDLGFFQATGRWMLNDIRENSSKLPTPEEQRRRWTEYRALGEKILGEARAKVARGEVYTPDDYYNHLLRLDQKRDELGEFVAIPWFPESDLQQFMHDCFNHGYTRGDIDKAYARWREVTPRYNHKEDKEVTKSQEKIPKNTHPREYGAWLWQRYLRNLGLAFVLFLIWAHESRKVRVGFAFPNPLHFIVALIFYPVIIGYVFRRWLQDTGLRWQAEAELRRTKEKLFAPLSQEDLEWLRQFLQNREHLTAWRQKLLSSGLRPRHTLAAALFVTAVLTIVGKGESQSQVQETHLGAEILVQVFVQYLPRMALNDESIAVQDAGVDDRGAEYDRVLLLPAGAFQVYWPAQRLSFHTSLGKVKTIAREIDHVPRSAIWL